GSRMPPLVDFRDLPHVWGEGFYQMDATSLRARLKTAELILGDVATTVPQALRVGMPPLGFVSFDLDYYSSTKFAFGIFGGPPETLRARVYCYFDDITGPETACINEYVGELLAIKRNLMLAADVARTLDPDLAAVYYRCMVEKGHHH